MSKQIVITAQNFLAFKKAYKAALKEKQETFTFEGQLVLCSYAKYLIEYVESNQRN